MPVMPTRKSMHMAVLRGVMIAQALVVTDSTTSGGWIGWMAAKMIPAGTAARPDQRIRFEGVGFMVVLPFDERRSRAGRDRALCQAGRAALPGRRPCHAAPCCRRSPESGSAHRTNRPNGLRGAL